MFSENNHISARQFGRMITNEKIGIICLFAGMLAGNYDIKEIFVDGIIKIGGADLNELGVMLDKLQTLTGSDTTIVFTISADNAELPASVTKFLD